MGPHRGTRQVLHAPPLLEDPCACNTPAGAATSHVPSQPEIGEELQAVIASAAVNPAFKEAQPLRAPFMLQDHSRT